MGSGGGREAGHKSGPKGSKLGYVAYQYEFLLNIFWLVCLAWVFDFFPHWDGFREVQAGERRRRKIWGPCVGMGVFRGAQQGLEGVKKSA